MPPKLARTTAGKLIKALEKAGFVKVRQRGSHVVLKENDGGIIRGCVVPLHDELAVGTLKGIIKQAGISQEELAALLG